MSSDHARRPVAKTYKLFVNGAFVRSESGRSLRQAGADGELVADCPRASRKDLRDAVASARAAFEGWSGRSAFNRSQVLFRLAEMIEGRRATWVELLGRVTGAGAAAAEREVDAAVDRVFWYAGWCDKLAQVLGGVNPIASPYNNFTFAEPTGVVVVLAPRAGGLLGLVSTLLPPLCAGNTTVLVADDDQPVLALELGECLATSDLPAGSVAVLSGSTAELSPHAASHMDVNAILCAGLGEEERREVGLRAAENVKRAVFVDEPEDGWAAPEGQSLYLVERLLEWKTSWHPIGI